MVSKSMPKSETLTFTPELKAIIQQAEDGNAAVLPKLRAILDENPSLWRNISDLTHQCEQQQIQLASGNNHLTAESLRRRVAAMRAEIGGLASTALERLLVDRVVISWLQLHIAELQQRQPDQSDMSLVRFLSKRQDQAHRRHLGAIRELYRLQKLLRPDKPVAKDITPEKASARTQTINSPIPEG